MKKLLIIPFLALALGACTSSGSGTGDTGTTTGGGGGLISVDISDVRAEIAKNIDVALEDVPITAQVAADVAADICGTNVNVLSVQIDTSDTTCKATATSGALEQAVRNQL